MPIMTLCTQELTTHQAPISEGLQKMTDDESILTD
jgi:hypothetical protein